MADINIILDAAPVQTVNGKIGFVTLSPQDIGITGLATSGDLSVLQNQIDNLDLNYASDLQLSQTGAAISSNLTATGQNLQNQINNLDLNYASDLQLSQTGQNLQSQINSLGNTYVTRTSGQFTNRPFVNGTGVLLSGEAARLPDTIVYTTGSQIISGSKTFYADNYIFSGANVIFVQNTGIVSGAWRFLNRPTVNNTGVLLQGELDLSVYATITNLATTGSNLQSQITGKANLVHTHVVANISGLGTAATRNVGTASNEVSAGNHTHVASDITNSTSAGRTLLTSSLSSQRSHLDFFPILPSLSSFPITGDVNRVYTALDTSKIYAWISLLNNYVEISPTQTGELDTRYALITNLANTGSTLSANINTTGNTLSNKIDTLSGNSVLTNGEQTIFGTKYFSNAVYISDLYVTGTEFIANVENKFIESPYILLNLTGGAVDGGLFFITGSGLTGVNDYGPIIGFDHSNKFKFGIARRSDDLSILNDIASVQELNLLSGNLNTLTTNLATTGSTLNTKVDNLSGYINSTASNIVFTTGNQIKSGRLIIGNDANSIVDPNSQYTLSLQTNSPATWLEILNNSGGNQGVFFGIQDNDFEQYNWQGGDIRFFTSENPGNGTERLIIKNDGKIGIDTHSPSEKLEVAGNIKVTNSGFFASGIKVGNSSIIITENKIDGGYAQSNGLLTDGLLGIQYSGYFSGDSEWFKTATLKPIINELVLTGVSSSGTYTRVSSALNQGTNYFQGPNGWRIDYYSQFPAEESYWYLHPGNYVQHYTSSDLETWSLATGIQAWDSGATYNINDIVSNGGSNWICKAYAPVGYGPFGGYLDGTENGTDYWDELPETQTSSITQTQNSENSTDFGVNRALSNGTSWEWVGYFVPQVTENYSFSLYADDDAYFWIGDKASNGYTSGNADINTNTGNALDNLPLNSGQSYPVRLQWGHKPTPTNLGLTLQYQIPNLSFSSYDFSGVFFQGSVSKGFYIDAVSGDGSFAGNVQANSATFNTRPTVNESGVLLQGELDLSVYATVTNLATTGSTLQSSVNTLTTNLATTGSTLQGQVNNRVTNLGGASGMRVLTTGEYNSLTPISGVLYILI
jgi:hypothetical protein